MASPKSAEQAGKVKTYGNVSGVVSRQREAGFLSHCGTTMLSPKTFIWLDVASLYYKKLPALLKYADLSINYISIIPYSNI